VIDEGGAIAVPTVAGLGAPGANPASGPAFVRAPDTTIFVPEGWSISFSPQGYGILARESGA
jgi:hypothetical protein